MDFNQVFLELLRQAQKFLNKRRPACICVKKNLTHANSKLLLLQSSQISSFSPIFVSKASALFVEKYIHNFLL